MTTFPSPILTVDVVVLALFDDALQVATLTRDADPFNGQQALPGGYVHLDKDQNTTDTARRVLKTKTDLTSLAVEQLATVSGPDRDPRGWSATVVHYALIQGVPAPSRGLTWVPAAAPGPLAFDHADLIAATLDRLRARGSWSNLPGFLLPNAFTLSDLRHSYELVMGVTLNDAAFRRKVDELDIICPLEGQKSKASARPAQLYRLKDPKPQAFDRRI